MDSENFSDSLKTFVADVLHFEKKKLILPVLMTFLLLGSVIYGVHLRDNMEIDEQVLDNRLELLTELNFNYLKSEYYPNDSGLTNKSILEKKRRDLLERNILDDQKLVKYYVGLGPAFIALNTEIYPLSPESAFNTGFKQDTYSSLIFPLSKGYISTRELPKSYVELAYRTRKFHELSEEANNTGLNYREFQQKVEDIKSLNYGDRKLRNYVFNKTSKEENDSPVGYNGILDSLNQKVRDNLKKDNWTEIHVINFVPSLFASFILYYVISGLILTFYRKSAEVAETLLNARELDHSIVLASSGFNLVLGVFILGLASLVLGSSPVWLAAFIMIQVVIGGAFYLISSLISESKSWFIKTGLISTAVLLLFGLHDLLTISSNYHFAILFLVLIGIEGITCWRIEEKIKKDYLNNKI